MTAAVASRHRRTRADIDRIKAAIIVALEADRPMTVRQVFYRLVSAGAIDKTEAEYKATVCRLLGEMRRAREIPFGWIADNTRWQRKPKTFGSLEAALNHTAATYRRSLWDEQDAYVEIWLEKDALAGVLLPVTAEWDVPLMVTRGYPSITYLHEAAEAIQKQGCPAHLYYFGDFDPSGVDITRAVEAGLREFAPDAPISFTRVAVTSDQIETMQLPTRPTKTTDSRSKGFGGESVEVDAIPPKTLKAIASGNITRHIDHERLAALKRVERAERETVRSIAADGYWGEMARANLEPEN